MTPTLNTTATCGHAKQILKYTVLALFALPWAILPLWLMIVNSFKPLNEATNLSIGLPQKWALAENYAAVIQQGNSPGGRVPQWVWLCGAGADVLEYELKTRNPLGLHMTADDVRPTERLHEQVPAPRLSIESQTYAAEYLFNAFVWRRWDVPAHAFSQKRASLSRSSSSDT